MQVYPTLVIRGTGLYELWKKGLYRNYDPVQLVDLVARILSLVPPWVRIYRIQVQSGLRPLALRELHQHTTQHYEIRKDYQSTSKVHAKVLQNLIVARDTCLNTRHSSSNILNTSAVMSTSDQIHHGHAS